MCDVNYEVKVWVLYHLQQPGLIHISNQNFKKTYKLHSRTQFSIEKLRLFAKSELFWFINKWMISSSSTNHVTRKLQNRSKLIKCKAKNILFFTHIQLFIKFIISVNESQWKIKYNFNQNFLRLAGFNAPSFNAHIIM